MDSLVYLTETIRADVDEDEFLTTALQDLSKAFDSVEHQFLMKNYKIEVLWGPHLILKLAT